MRKNLLNLPLKSASSSKDIATDMFVFDNVVAVRLDTGKFTFFGIPLNDGNYAEEIPIEEEVEVDTIAGTSNTFSDILALGML